MKKMLPFGLLVAALILIYGTPNRAKVPTDVTVTIKGKVIKPETDGYYLVPVSTEKLSIKCPDKCVYTFWHEDSGSKATAQPVGYEPNGEFYPIFNKPGIWIVSGDRKEPFELKFLAQKEVSRIAPKPTVKIFLDKTEMIPNDDGFYEVPFGSKDFGIAGDQPCTCTIYPKPERPGEAVEGTQIKYGEGGFVLMPTFYNEGIWYVDMEFNGHKPIHLKFKVKTTKNYHEARFPPGGGGLRLLIKTLLLKILLLFFIYAKINC